MSDIVTGVRQLIQDLIAPDLKAIAAKQEALVTRIDGLEKSLILHLEAIAKNIDAFRAEMRSELLALRSANQLEVHKRIAPLAERLTVLEAQRTRH